MKTAIRSSALLAALLFLSGCVVAPVPLVETENYHGWNGTDYDGKQSMIMGQAQTWYLPIVASPEGPAKMRQRKSHYRYYFTTPDAHVYDNDWPKLAELPWLEVETSFGGFWRGIERVEGTPYWIAVRLTDFEESVHRNPPMRTYEIAIFDRKALQQKLTIRACNWPSLIEPHYLKGWNYDRSHHTIEYVSPAGRRRLALLTGIEEPLSPTPK